MCDFESPHLEMTGSSSIPDRCVFSYGRHLAVSDFYNKHPFFSSNEILMRDLINGDLVSSSEVYYGNVEDCDSHACGDLLLCRKIKIGDVRSFWGTWIYAIFLQLVFHREMWVDISLLTKSRNFILFLEKGAPFKVLYPACP